MGFPVTAPPLPLFLDLAGRRVLLVGGGRMAAIRARQLAGVDARVTVVAPEVREEVAALAGELHRRPFRDGDLDGAWLAVAAATPGVNREVARAAEARRLFVNAVDDPEHATAYTGGVVRRGDATVAVSTGGRAPALAGLLREALDALLPVGVGEWVDLAEVERRAWRRDGVPLQDRRRLLWRALAGRYGGGVPDEPPPPRGLVSLVGAGPGDPGLLTRRAAHRLHHADVLLHDALVQPGALDLAPSALRIPVGKRAGGPSASQRAIERLLVRAARRGRRVVRLKCGDPFVLGRGGEEARALADAGVPFEVVPGVSSALAAPELAGIPVTHRGLASGFAVLSGHAEAAFGPIVDGIAPGSLTLVVLMGLQARAAVAARLLARGWPAATPAAVLLDASGPGAFSWRGTLAGLAEAALPLDRAGLPGTLVVGAVAALSLAPPLGPADCGPPGHTAASGT